MLFVFSKSFNLMGHIGSFISLIWEEEYCGRGSFQLVLANESGTIGEQGGADLVGTRIIRQGRYIYQKGKKTAMVIRSIRVSEKDGQIIINGFTTLDILRQRVRVGTTKIENVELSMYHIADYVRAEIEPITGYNDLRFKNYSIAETKGFEQTLDTQFTNWNVLDMLIALGNQSGLGFFMGFEHENQTHVFTVYEGKDFAVANESNNPHVVFSEEYGTLSDVEIVDDKSIFANNAWVAGEGEGNRRFNQNVSTYPINDRPDAIDIFQISVDARDLRQTITDESGQETLLNSYDYGRILEGRGLAKLTEHPHVDTFTGTINPIGFGIDYNLGDIVTCISKKHNRRIDARITQFKEVTEGNTTTLRLTLGEPEITLKGEINTWL